MYNYPAPPLTKGQILAQRLSNWWWRRGEHSMSTSAWVCDPLLRPATYEEQVRTIAAELAQDAELAQFRLCGFLGTTEGKVIAAAVEAAIPQPYRLVVQGALMLICQQQGAGRQALLGWGAFILSAVGLIALAEATAVVEEAAQ